MRSILLIVALLAAPGTASAQCTATFRSYGEGCQTVVAQVPTLSGDFDAATCTVSLTLDAFSGCCNTFLSDRLFALGLQTSIALPPWPGCSLLVAPVAVAALPASAGDTLSFQLPAGLPSFSIYSQGIAIYASTIGGPVPRGVSRAPQFSQGLEIAVAPQNTTQDLGIEAAVSDVRAADLYRFDFESGPQGWRVGYADYPIGKEEFYELARQHRTLPPAAAPGASGMWLQGNNHSDDLFMYLVRRVGGLVPGEEYAVDVVARVASQYPASWLGIGGAPGSSVYLHAGASTEEPVNVVQPGVEPWWVLNIDKGNQAMGGANSSVLGHIGIPGEEGIWTLLERRSTQSVIARANAHGELWLHIGTDSGFEGLTEVYFDEVVFAIRPKS